MLIFLDYFGTIIFALTGILIASKKEMDIFGALVLATVTAIGGGTLRDLLLGIEPFWIKNVFYLYMIATTGIISFFLIKWVEKIPAKTLEVADAIGLASFTITGVSIAQNHYDSETVCVMMGIITAVAGGAARDVLSNQIPFVLRGRGFYATASLIGGTAGVLITPYVSDYISYIIVGGVTLTLRLFSIYNILLLPAFQKTDD